MLKTSLIGRRLFLCTAVAAILGVSAVAAPVQPSEPVVQRVSVTATSGGDGYVVRLHSSDYVHAYSSARKLSRTKYEVILFNTELVKPYKHQKPSGPLVSYVFEHRGEHLVFSFDLIDTMSFEVNVYRDRDSNDLLVGLQHVASPPVAVKVQVAKPAPPVPIGPSIAARDRWKLDTIVIDAGHGGKDPGASVRGILEKDVALAVARKLGAYLEDLLGVKVVYTREDDRFVELKKRGKIANESGGKLFVSIHANAQRRGSAARGTETYFLGLHKSRAARDVMDRENSVVSLEENAEQYSAFREENLIRQTLAQSAYIHKSQQLAMAIDKQFKDRVQRQSRGVHQAGFYVLWSASMPAVLVELGFLTNRREAAFLNSESGQTYMASALYRAIRDFKETYERELNLVSSTR